MSASNLCYFIAGILFVTALVLWIEQPTAGWEQLL